MSSETVMAELKAPKGVLTVCRPVSELQEVEKAS